MECSRRAFLAASAGVLAAGSMTAGAQETAPKLRVCVIGDTKMGGYGHGLHLAWAHRDDIEIVGLADPDEAGRLEHAAAANAQRAYADYREMLGKEKPDVVTIAPRCTVRHAEYLLAAAECGAHGFMEKPMAVDLAEADAMVQAIEAKGLKWAMAFNWHTVPLIEHARRLVVEERLIGDLLEMRARGKEDHRSGAEDLIVLGVHVFDLMRFFAGDPQWCVADIEVEHRPATLTDVKEATEPLGPIMGDTVHAMYGFANGVRGYFASARNTEGGGGRWGVDLYGTQGVVVIRCEPRRGAQVRLFRDPSWSPSIGEVAKDTLPDAPAPKPEQTPRYGAIVDDLVAAIREDRLPKVSLQDGRAAHEMIQGVFAAHLRGCRTGLPLAERKHPLRS